ncbi:hypothetical protein F5Y05DRAFT_320832 [Hypoxylon sp. FL0543]|nr:hypothetical protein F5Y05DRAFT_320832 [Hypoxylon sp. FL0543]
MSRSYSIPSGACIPSPLMHLAQNSPYWLCLCYGRCISESLVQTIFLRIKDMHVLLPCLSVSPHKSITLCLSLWKAGLSLKCLHIISCSFVALKTTGFFHCAFLFDFRSPRRLSIIHTGELYFPSLLIIIILSPGFFFFHSPGDPRYRPNGPYSCLHDRQRWRKW